MIIWLDFVNIDLTLLKITVQLLNDDLYCFLTSIHEFQSFKFDL